MAESKPLTPNQRKRRQRILSAARELVARNGYDGMIMRDVAVRADVSPTTLYNLYNTKDELLLAALREEVTESWRRAANGSEGPGYDFLLNHVEQVVRQTRREAAYVEAITEALLRARAGDPLADTLLRAARAGFRNSLAAMAERGELKPDTDLDALASALIGGFWAAFLLWNKGLIPLKGLEPMLKRNYLSLLIPASRGKARTKLEGRYRSLRPSRT